MNVAISLLDKASSPLKSIAESAETASASIKSIGTSGTSSLDSVATKTETARAKMLGASSAVSNFGTNIQKSAHHTGGLVSQIKGLIGTLGGLWAVQKAFGLINSSIETVMNRTQQETKLATIMKQRMGTGNIKAPMATMQKESKTGVVGTSTQMAGAQQAATFLTQKSSLDKLIPAMNSLAVQQHGVNVSGEQMRNIGNMVGKVMQGQTGALRRVGITFTSAQEKALKYGNEQKRAATLAQVITNNVGHMNQALAKTPEGRMQQMRNNLAGIKLQIGQAIMPSVMHLLNTLSTNMPAITTMARGFAVVISAVTNVLSGVISVVSKIIGKFATLFGKTANFHTMTNAVSFLTKAFLVAIAAIGIFKGAVAITNAISAISAARASFAAGATLAEAAATSTATGAQVGLNIAMLACPLTWIVLAIVAVIAAIVLIVRHWQAIEKKFKAFGKIIKPVIDAFKNFGSKIKSVFSKAADHIKGFWGKTKGCFSKMKGGFQELGSGIKGWFTDKLGLNTKEGQRHMRLLMLKTQASMKGMRRHFSGLIDFVSGVFTGNWSKAWTGVKKIFSDVWSGIKNVCKTAVNGVITIINFLIKGLDKINVKTPKWFSKKTGISHFGFEIPTIPYLAKGTENWGGGLAQVNEKGGEIMDLPKGTRVIPHDVSKKVASQAVSKKVVIAKVADRIVISKEVDADKVFDRIVNRIEQASVNMG